MKKSRRYYVAEGVVLRTNEVLHDLKNSDDLGAPEADIHIRAACTKMLNEFTVAGVINRDESKDLVEKIGELPFREKPEEE